MDQHDWDPVSWFEHLDHVSGSKKYMKILTILLITGVILILPTVGAKTVSEGGFGGEIETYSPYVVLFSGSFNGSVIALNPPTIQNNSISSGSFNGTIELIPAEEPEEPTPTTDGTLSWMKKIMIIEEEI